MEATNVFYNIGMNACCNNPNEEWVIDGYLKKGEVGFVNWTADRCNYYEDELMATMAVCVSQGAWWCSHRAYTTKVLILNHKRKWLNPTLAMAMTRICMYMPNNIFVTEEEPVKGQFVTKEEVLDFCLQNNIELVVINDGMTLASVWSGNGPVAHESEETFNIDVLKPFTDNKISVLMTVSRFDNYFKGFSEPDVYFDCTKFKFEEGIGDVAEYKISSKHRSVDDVYVINQNNASLEAQSFKYFHRCDEKGGEDE